MSWAKTFDHAKDPSDWAYLVCAVFSCGYSQPKRDRLSEMRLLNGTAETDCSYGVNWWLWKGGFLDECVGFSTRTEIDYLEANGFTLLGMGTEPQRNDVLWRPGHTAMYIGDGLQAEALRTERGDAGYNGSAPGDQDGGETVVRAYDPSDWTYILRPPAHEQKKQGWIKEDGDWFFYVDNEKLRKDWKKWNGEWYYLCADGTMAANMWIKDKGFWYYLDGSGKMVKGYHQAGTSDWYFFDGSGRMLASQPVKHMGGLGWCWLGSDGKCMQSGTLKIEKGIIKG